MTKEEREDFLNGFTARIRAMNDQSAQILLAFCDGLVAGKCQAKAEGEQHDGEAVPAH